jgi:HSP20 family protein
LKHVIDAEREDPAVPPRRRRTEAQEKAMLTRWSDLSRTFAALEEYRRHINRAFAETDDPRWTQQTDVLTGTSWPPISLYDEGNKLVLDADVPGLAERDIQLSLNQNVLSISGERKVEAPEGYAIHRQERGAIRFARSISLPCQVDTDKVAAHVKDGLLTVTMEKSKEAQPRQITIKAS